MLCTALYLILLVGTCASLDYSTVKSDYETILDISRGGSNVQINDVIPSVSFPINVTLGMAVFAVMDFDAVSGTIKLVTSLSLSWLDQSLSFSATTLSNQVDSVFLSYDQIWTPNLVLMNDVESIQHIGDSSYKIRYNLQTGLCTWNPRMIINAACSPDMTFYPFDKQSCVLKIMPSTSDRNKVQLHATGSWDTDSLETSAVWVVTSTSSVTSIANGKYAADFKITIKRKPLFLALVIVLPILLLSLLSGFLFLLPAGSGERVGFGITCFLSFVFLLQMLMGLMPEVSTPMSLLCYYVIVMLGFTVVLSIINIFLMRMYLSPSQKVVPGAILTFLDVVTCKVCRRCKLPKRFRRWCCRLPWKKSDYEFFKKNDERFVKADFNANKRFNGPVPNYFTKSNDYQTPVQIIAFPPRLRSARSGLASRMSKRTYSEASMSTALQREPTRLNTAISAALTVGQSRQASVLSGELTRDPTRLETATSVALTREQSRNKSVLSAKIKLESNGFETNRSATLKRESTGSKTGMSTPFIKEPTRQESALSASLKRVRNGFEPYLPAKLNRESTGSKTVMSASFLREPTRQESNMSASLKWVPNGFEPFLSATQKRESTGSKISLVVPLTREPTRQESNMSAMLKLVPNGFEPYLPADVKREPTALETAMSAPFKREPTQWQSRTEHCAPGRGHVMEGPNSKTERGNLSWESIAKTLDIFFIVLFCGVQVVFSLFFLVPIGAQYLSD